MNFRWQVAQFFEALWWQRYLKKKPYKEYVDWKKKYWLDFLNRFEIKIDRTDIILEAGCGPAGISIIFEENNVTGIDPLLNKYENLHSRLKVKSNQKHHFERVELENYVCHDFFDKVFCLNVINHVYDLERCLKNLSISVKKRGEVYISVDAHNFRLLKFIFQLIPGDILHPQQFDLKDYMASIAETKLSISKIHLLKTGFIFNYYLIIAVKE